jgi:putative phage-type endonuclease
MRLTERNHELRATRVGASEVAALMPWGHPYHTRSDVYARIVHGVTRPANAAMEMGSLMEDAVFAWGKAKADVPRARRNARTYVHPTLPLAATPDGIVLGRSAIVETKSVSGYADDWTDGPPRHFVTQCQAQMLVTGRQWCHLWAFVGGSRIETYLLEEDPLETAAIAIMVERFFHEHVYPRVPPEEALEDDWALTVTGLEGTVVADGDLLDVGRRLNARTNEHDITNGFKEAARADMARAMASVGAKVVIGPGWRAEAKAAPTTGKVGIRFYQSKGAMTDDR